MNAVQKLAKQLVEERNHKYKNGIYCFTQVEMAYNSNRIEGSKLKKEHTESLFSTKTILVQKDDVIKSDDIIETTNHFRAFDYLLDTLSDVLSEAMIKEFHRILKTNTSDADIEWFNVGEYKKVPNMVGGMETTPPKEVANAVRSLLKEYNSIEKHSFDDVLDFHVKFEKIHPFGTATEGLGD